MTFPLNCGAKVVLFFESRKHSKKKFKKNLFFYFFLFLKYKKAISYNRLYKNITDSNSQLVYSFYIHIRYLFFLITPFFILRKVDQQQNGE